MIESRLTAARGDREIDAGIIEHPFGVVRLYHGGLHGEERRVKSDCIRDVLDCDVDMHAFHGDTSSLRCRHFGALRPRWLAGWGADSGLSFAAVISKIAEQRIHSFKA